MEESNLQNNTDNMPEVKIEISPELKKVKDSAEKIRQEVGKIIVGQNQVTDLLITALFSRGHVLLEGVPGIAKTLSAKLIAKTLDTAFSRIQFTPDLMPSDIIGTSIYNVKTSEFEFRKGPIFSNIVLVDEINRSPAKTQAAMFEVMEEKQITTDGNTYQMGFPFIVIATQNPVEQEGTYRLPEAQLDRFLFRIKMTYPDIQEEISILNRFKGSIKDIDFSSVNKVISANDMKEFQSTIESVTVEEQILNYIAQLVLHTREHTKLFLGASPRASLAILKTSKTIAAIKGRDFVIPDDVQQMAYPVLNHRIILTPEAEMEGLTSENIIQDIIQKTEVPR
jgi:MoxR-like ATPase